MSNDKLITNMSQTITNTSLNGPAANGLSFLSWTSQKGDTGNFLQLCTKTTYNTPTVDGAFQFTNHSHNHNHNFHNHINIKNQGVADHQESEPNQGWVTTGQQASSTGQGVKVEVSTKGTSPHEFILEQFEDGTYGILTLNDSGEMY